MIKTNQESKAQCDYNWGYSVTHISEASRRVNSSIVQKGLKAAELCSLSKSA